MNLERIENIEVSKGVLHDLCFMHPAMGNEQFESLKDSLNLIGQQQPVITYRGKIIDGRHRMIALQELNIPFAHAVELPRNTRMGDVEMFVKGSETRRHQTKTQMACHAYLLLIDSKSNIKTAAQAALEKGVSKADVSMCKTIAENVGIKAVEDLSLGKVINLAVNGTYSNYSSVRRLYDAIKRKQKEFIAKKPAQNVAFNLSEERANVRNFCQNDSVEKISAKLQLMQEYLNDKVEIE